MMASTIVHAGSLAVQPAVVILTADRQREVIKISAPDAESVAVQVRVLKWIQSDNEDRFSSTTEVQVIPTVVTISSARLGVVHLRSTTTPASEEAYAVVIDELVTGARYTIPLFVRPRGHHRVQIEMTAQIAGNTLQVRTTNVGETYARLRNLQVRCADGAIHTKDGLLGHILVKSTRTWIVSSPVAACPEPAKVTALIDDGI